MALVPKIEDLCKECNTTVTALERDCGLSLGSVRRWDKNSPSIDRVVLVAKALSTTVSYLIGETDEKNPPPFLRADLLFYDALVVVH